MGGLIVAISFIMGIFAVGLAIVLFLPAIHLVAYVDGTYQNMPPEFQIMRDQIYEIVLASAAIIGLGVGGLYVFNNAGKTTT